MADDKKGKGEKRSWDMDLAGSSQSSGEGSQTESTPTKKRVSWNYWNKKPVGDVPKEESVVRKLDFESSNEQLTISELKTGQYVNKPLMFRVSYTSGLRSTQAGATFTFHGIDNGSEIAFVAFREEANRCAEIAKINGVLELQNFAVKEESKKYPTGTGHGYQIYLTSTSSFKELNSDNITIRAIPFNFIQLSELINFPTDTKADVIAIVVQDWGSEKVFYGSQKEKETLKRDLTLTDASQSCVLFTLWGVGAESFSGRVKCPLILRKAIVSEYGGEKTLKSGFDTLCWEDPEHEDVAELSSWFADADDGQ